MEWVATVLVAAGCFNPGVSEVAPGEPHRNTLWVMLCGTTNPVASPSKLWLLGTFVNAAIPVPALIGSTDVYLTPEFECSPAFFFKKPIDVKRQSTFASSSNTSNASLMAIKPHRMTRESTQRVAGVDTKLAFFSGVG
jgi:hypothetical protein